MRPSTLLLSVLLLVLPLLGSGCATLGRRIETDPEQPVSAQERYADCLKAFQRGFHTRAIELCTHVRNYHRDDPVSVLAELLIADIYFKQGNIEQARLAYEDFARMHPRHERLDYAIFRIGLCWNKAAPKLWAGRDQTTTRQAINVWTGFDRQFPESPHRDEVAEAIEKARTRLARKELLVARFYQDREAWDAVRARATFVVERYPDTRLAPDALALVARSWHAWGFLAEARAARDRLAETFPDRPALLTQVDRWLTRPPGERPAAVVFLRPYRIPQAGGLGMAGAAQAGAMMPGMGM